MTRGLPSLAALRLTSVPPRVIFLDAVGTLFGVKGSVGQVYGDLAAQFGVMVDPQALNLAFMASFQTAPAPVGTLAPRDWWRAVVKQTFGEAVSQFADFEAFFISLYDHFATAKPWFVYPDVRPFLDHWHQAPVPLGVISNFDSRLYPILTALDLADYFTSVTISTQVGAAKPQAQIFEAALQTGAWDPSYAWHVGDSYREDYLGACGAGLQGIWLERS